MPRIEAVDFFYVSMPKVIEDIGDGSQDACVVRVAAGEARSAGASARRRRCRRSRG
jgi:hypothetical protein